MKYEKYTDKAFVYGRGKSDDKEARELKGRYNGKVSGSHRALYSAVMTGGVLFATVFFCMTGAKATVGNTNSSDAVTQEKNELFDNEAVEVFLGFNDIASDVTEKPRNAVSVSSDEDSVPTGGKITYTIPEKPKQWSFWDYFSDAIAKLLGEESES